MNRSVVNNSYFKMHAGQVLFDRSASARSTRSFGSQLKARIETWAAEELDVQHPYLELARDYLAACDVEIEDNEERQGYAPILHDLESSLAARYLERFVKVVFCTLADSDH